MRISSSKLVLGSLIVLTTVAFAAESENQDKMQEDLDSYKDRIVSNCGSSKLAIKWDGKLGGNPRETPEGHYTSLSTLCQSALDATSNVCQSNRVMKKEFGKVTSIVCTRGNGTMSYSFKGSTLTFKVDSKFDKNNAAGQQSDLEKKMKDDIDK